MKGICMNNIGDEKKLHNCTGCAACVAICPKKAISYIKNSEGFFQAFVDEKKCINCGKCKKVCYKFMKKVDFEKKLEDGILYSAQSNNPQIVQKSSSGGVAYEIAKFGVENGYKVIGTIYDYKQEIAKAIIIERLEDIELLSGSKYIQSNFEDAQKKFVEICRNDISAKFIVFGTPCQILGFSNIVNVNKIKNEVIKVELFCHGVPSYHVWDCYIEEIKQKYRLSNIEKIDFRNKKLGWHNYCIKICGEKRTIYQNSEKSLFYKAFFDTILYNKCCFDCQMRMKYSFADVRLGDFWGKRYINDINGVSAVVIFSEKGKELIEMLNSVKFERCLIEECLANQSTQIYSNIKLRDEYLEKLSQNKDLKRTIKEYRKKMPIKNRINYFLKEIVCIFPLKLRMMLKNIYHKNLYK